MWVSLLEKKKGKLIQESEQYNWSPRGLLYLTFWPKIWMTLCRLLNVTLSLSFLCHNNTCPILRLLTGIQVGFVHSEHDLNSIKVISVM